MNIYLRKVNVSLAIVGGLPDQHSLQLIPVVTVGNRRTFGDDVGVISLLPLSDPLVSLSIPRLQEEATESVTAVDGDCKRNEEEVKTYVFKKEKIKLTLYFSTGTKLIGTCH